MPAWLRSNFSFRSAVRMVVVLAYLALALWTTWPLTLTLTRDMPVGIMQVTTVPLLNVWTIWWNSDRVLHGFSGYWNAPIFHPTANTFAFSEPQPTTLLVAPVIWITGSRVLAYNVYLWLSLVLNGVFAERLLRVSGVTRFIAICGGMGMILLPIVHWQLDVLQLAPLWAILWTWTACLQAGNRPDWRRGLELGIAFTLAFFTSGHHGLFLATLLVGSVWILIRKWFAINTWVSWIIAGLVILLLAGPMILHLRSVLAGQSFDRDPKLIEQLSVHPSDYLRTTGINVFDFNSVKTENGQKVWDIETFWCMSPGWIKIGLALFAVAIGLSRRRWRRWSAFLLMTGVLAFLMSLGPHLQIGGWQPWWTLTHIIPGMSRVRNVFRFAFFVQMAIVLLAAQGLYFLSVIIRRYSHSWIWRKGLQLVLLVLGSAAIFEARPDKLDLKPAPDIVANWNWVNFIRVETPPGKAIACIPFPNSESAFDFESASRWMYFGTYHGVPMVNGYSGFFTAEYFEFHDAIASKFPDERTRKKLADLNVEFLVVDNRKTTFPPEKIAEPGDVTADLVYQDQVGIEIYRLRRIDEVGDQTE